jgi:hypothetical protein
MYEYQPGEYAAANATEALSETQRLRARVTELEKQVSLLNLAVDNIAEKVGMEP